MIFNTAHTKNSIDMDVICLHLSTCIRTIKNLLSIGFLFTGCCRVTRMGDNWPCVGAELNATSYKQHSVFTCWRLSWHGKYFLKGFKMEQINNDVCLYLIWVFPSQWGRQTELWSSWEPCFNDVNNTTILCHYFFLFVKTSLVAFLQIATWFYFNINSILRH